MAAAIILAAGMGTRMKSDLPKVLHPVCGLPMLTYVINAVRDAGCEKIILVVGHRQELVRETYAPRRDVAFVEQIPQQGTGHAVMVCQKELASLEGPVLILGGDGPLIQAHTLKELLAKHAQERAACTLATSVLDKPEKYGRILRDERTNELTGIIEYAEATDAQKAIREVNVSVYCFDAAALRSVLPRVTNNNNKKEYYLTDTLGLLRGDGKKLAAVAAVPPEDAISINTPDELAEVSRIMAARDAKGKA